jgi:hypothetical protein
VYSPISIVNFFSYFAKNIFYDEKSSRPIGFVLALNGCDDGNLIQEDINFEDIATQAKTTMTLFSLKERSTCS